MLISEGLPDAAGLLLNRCCGDDAAARYGHISINISTVSPETMCRCGSSELRTHQQQH